jgi:hypothetical protein
MALGDYGASVCEQFASYLSAYSIRLLTRSLALAGLFVLVRLLWPLFPARDNEVILDSRHLGVAWVMICSFCPCNCRPCLLE